MRHLTPPFREGFGVQRHPHSFSYFANSRASAARHLIINGRPTSSSTAREIDVIRFENAPSSPLLYVESALFDCKRKDPIANRKAGSHRVGAKINYYKRIFGHLRRDFRIAKVEKSKPEHPFVVMIDEFTQSPVIALADGLQENRVRIACI